MAGRVHVDFWIVAFDINFGDHITKEERIGLADFYDLVLQDSPASSFVSAQGLLTGKGMKQLAEPIAATSMKKPRNEAHNFLAESGLLNPDDKPERGQDDPWTVRAGSFVFVAKCKMAVTAVQTSDTDSPIFQQNDVFSKPIQLTSSMTSVLSIKVTREGGSSGGDDWQFERYSQKLPSALWAKCKSCLATISSS